MVMVVIVIMVIMVVMVMIKVVGVGGVADGDTGVYTVRLTLNQQRHFVYSLSFTSHHHSHSLHPTLSP